MKKEEMSEKKLETHAEAGAAGYDEMLKNDWRLRLEVEAKERMFQNKQAVKRQKEAKEEEKKKKLKKLLKRRARRRFRWF